MFVEGRMRSATQGDPRKEQQVRTSAPPVILHGNGHTQGSKAHQVQGGVPPRCVGYCAGKPARSCRGADPKTPHRHAQKPNSTQPLSRVRERGAR